MEFINIILLGPPGAGKGTQSAILQKQFNLCKISTGDLIREEINNNTSLGKSVENIVQQGLIVSDEIIMEIVEKKILFISANFIFDGVPRTFWQAEALDNILTKINQEINLVIEIKVDQNKLINRISERYSCSNCNQVYSTKIRPKTENICDLCGSNSFIRRSDDNEKSLNKRLIIYNDHIKPLIEHYRKKNVLISIDGSKNVEEINREIIESLSQKMNKKIKYENIIS